MAVEEEALYHSSGTFTVDAQAARRKLGTQLIGSLDRAVLKLVQAGVAGGAKSLRIKLARGSRLYAEFELAQDSSEWSAPALLAALVQESGSRSQRHLAAALRAYANFGEIRWWDPQGRALQASSSEAWLTAPQSPVGCYRLEAHLPGYGRWITEHALLYKRASLAPLELWLDGRRLDFNWTFAPDPHPPTLYARGSALPSPQLEALRHFHLAERYLPGQGLRLDPSPQSQTQDTPQGRVSLNRKCNCFLRQDAGPGEIHASLAFSLGIAHFSPTQGLLDVLWDGVVVGCLASNELNQERPGVLLKAYWALPDDVGMDLSGLVLTTARLPSGFNRQINDLYSDLLAQKALLLARVNRRLWWTTSNDTTAGPGIAAIILLMTTPHTMWWGAALCSAWGGFKVHRLIQSLLPELDKHLRRHLTFARPDWNNARWTLTNDYH